MKSVTFVCVLLALWTSSVHGLKCYSCVSNAVAPDETCESDARNVTLVECSPLMNYCLTMITESAVIDGINATLRTCIDEPLYDNGPQQFDRHTIHYRTCQRDGCNAASSVRVGLPLVLLIWLANWTVC